MSDIFENCYDISKHIKPMRKKDNFGVDAYKDSPGLAFLEYFISARKSYDYFSRKSSQYGERHLQNITIAMLPSIMGHFETYQRFLFSGLFDLTVCMDNFDIDKFFRDINNQTSFSIDPVRLSSYRAVGSPSVGILIADSLPGWHNPSKINKYFEFYFPQKPFQIYGSENIDFLLGLWQLRHSIVHTGGVITQPDSQKIRSLSDFSEGARFVPEETFWEFLLCRFNSLIKSTLSGLHLRFTERQVKTLHDDEKVKIENLFKYK